MLAKILAKTASALYMVASCIVFIGLMLAWAIDEPGPAFIGGLIAACLGGLGALIEWISTLV